MKTRIFILAFVLMSASSFAQQNAQYNQYIFNELLLNPAYAGTKDVWNINGVFSSQWTGLKGAPSTATLSTDGAVSPHIGLGFHFINDMIGAQMEQSLFGSYAYKINLTKKLRLSLGLAVGASYFTLDGTKLNPGSEWDPAVPVSSQSALRFDSKAGFFLYSNRFYTGFSVSDLLGDAIRYKNIDVTNQARHYYLTAGYVADIGKKVKFKPSFLLKEDFKSPTTLDVNAMFLFVERFWLGASVRFNAKIFHNAELDNTLRDRNAMVFMTDWNITDKFRLGYAYALTLTSLKNYSSHEIHLAYYFPRKNVPKMETPRYF
jgi:type IX secretion system PorP/SprF family membrane protein